MRTDLEDDDLVSGLTRKGQRKAPRRAYGTLRRKGRISWIGSWKVDPASVMKVKGAQRKALVRIFQKTSGHCHFCGDPLDFDKVGRKHPKGWEKDHIIPKKQGGARRQDNLLPAHWRCNALRWARGFERLKELIRVGLIGMEEINGDTETGLWLKERLAGRKVANRKRRARYRQHEFGGN
jgi:5-methylcytosine-specific restriction endonuclease McrA